jgi:hypothetical protein
VEIIRAKQIGIPFEKLKNEIISLGSKQIEVVLAEVPVHTLKLDRTNPRIQYQLEANGLGADAQQEDLRNLFWGSPVTKRLKRDIERNGGLIEPIIISGKDGTTLNGNRRLTSYLMLHKEFPDDERWMKIRAFILPPEVTLETVDELLSEQLVTPKNVWTPFEQAAHLFWLSEKGYEHKALAQAHRMSRSRLTAKLKAYRLMRIYLGMARDVGKEIKDGAQKYSWFEEFYKKCKPNKKVPTRVYNGKELERKFCEWLLNDQLLQAADFLKLDDCLKDKRAIGILDKGGGIDNAHNQAAANRPELTSEL